MLAVLTGAVLLAGSDPEEVQQVSVRLHGGRLRRGLRTRPPAGARASNHPMPAEHAVEYPRPVLCGVLQPCMLLRRPRGRGPRLSISRSAEQALWVSDGRGWRPAVTTYSSTHAMGLARPPSRTAGVAAGERMGCRASLMARQCSLYMRMQLSLVEGRG